MIFDLRNISYIGKTIYDADFGISQNDRRRHLHVIGQTRTGKSTTLLHLISQDLATGRGMALLDPLGDAPPTSAAPFGPAVVADEGGTYG